MARTAGSIGEETSRQILSAALILFARQGFAAVSMRQIASETGIQAGAIYNHFPNKQAILHTLLEAHMKKLLDAVDACDLSNLNPSEALQSFIKFHIGYHIDKADEVFIAYMELRSLEPANFRTIQSLRQRYERILRDILRRGMKANLFKVTDPPVSAMAIIAMLTGVNTWFRYGGRLSVLEIEMIYVNMVMRSVGHEGDVKLIKQQEVVA